MTVDCSVTGGGSMMRRSMTAEGAMTGTGSMMGDGSMTKESSMTRGRAH